MHRPWPALIVVVLAIAARAADGPQKVATVEGITEYRLANGAARPALPRRRRGRRSPST